MRGKAFLALTSMCVKGITPAHAGKSNFRCRIYPGIWDHPRTCGEKASFVLVVWSIAGSPPHMRGKVLQFPLCPLPSRITPAHAGKRKASFDPQFMQRDHPRTCGEKTIYVDTYPGTLGSPPHMRGKALAGQLRFGLLGITPAHAGKRGGALK